MPYITDPNTGNQIWDGESVPSASRESVRNSITELNADVVALDERLDTAEAAFTLDVEDDNIASPASNLDTLGAGTKNILIGVGAGENMEEGSGNVSVGKNAMNAGYQIDSAISIGDSAGENAETGAGSIFIGANAQPAASGTTNEIVIGQNGSGGGSNTTVIGNNSTLTATIKGNLIVDGLAKSIRLGGSAGDQTIAFVSGIPVVSAAEGSIRLSSNGNIYVYKSATWREVALV